MGNYLGVLLAFCSGVAVGAIALIVFCCLVLEHPEPKNRRREGISKEEAIHAIRSIHIQFDGPRGKMVAVEDCGKAINAIREGKLWI